MTKPESGEEPIQADATPQDGARVIPEIRQAVGDKPLVAIGGIDEHNIADVARAGADCAAVIGALQRSSNPAETFATLRAQFLQASPHRN